MSGFNDFWYAGIIKRFAPDVTCFDTDEGKALACLGRMILAAACVVAQSVDGLTGGVHAVGAALTPPPRPAGADPAAGTGAAGPAGG